MCVVCLHMATLTVWFSVCWITCAGIIKGGIYIYPLTRSDKSVNVWVCLLTYRDLISELGEQYIISGISTSGGFVCLKYFASQTTQPEIMDFLWDIKEKSIIFFFFPLWKVVKSLENKIPEICEGIKSFCSLFANTRVCPHTRTLPRAHTCCPFCRDSHQTHERTPAGVKRYDLGAFHPQV